MHELYRLKQFDAAAILCGELAGKFGGQMDKYYRMWTERCEFMKQQYLDPDWQGQWIATEK